MIVPRPNKFYRCFFNWYIRHIIRRHFSELVIHNQAEVSQGALMVVGNHFSWWDGFFAWEVNRRIWKKNFHVMMLEEQIVKHRFFTRLGAFSIKKGSRDAIRSLDFGASLLSKSSNMLLVFPQGSIQSQHIEELEFQNGWFRMFQKAEKRPQMVFMICLTDYFSRPRPRLSIYLKNYHCDDLGDASKVAKAFNEFHKECKHNQKP